MRTRTALLALAMFLAAVATIHAEGPALETDNDRVLYALGLALSQNLTAFGLTAEELALVQAGLADGAMGREPRVALQEMRPQIQAMLKTRVAAQAEEEKEAGSAYRAEMAKEPGAVVKDSGLVYRELKAGTGASPAATDTTRIHYHGTLRDGTVFDSSRDRGAPATFSLQQVVPCFREGLQQMKVGGKGKLTCPPEIAYGDRGSPPKIRPGATITFEVELLEIVQKPAAASSVP
jgi:FKBP-type peptidyl-prolyl cis-trans isomerase FkpA/FKBP-type peptidyl-prolyl cis-trans isomerase FklB